LASQIEAENWEQVLEKDGQDPDLKSFVESIKQAGCPNKVVIDCTASGFVASFYPELFQNGVHVVTPNKKANSGTQADYDQLQRLTTNTDTKFMYETNVGAGLPVISTLKDLLDSGDEIVSIEGILSGTLSYLFNSFDGTKSFSEVVKEAQKLGYTEPDPRDDLNGLDVARKILILARECSTKLEMEDIEIENLVPEDCRQTESVDDFFTRLAAHDEYFANKLNSAREQDQVLRYIAKFEGGRTKVNLQAVDSSHPFYALSGSDNIIAFTTKRYVPGQQLVVKGPGAGAAVTAGGVFADLLKIVGR
jgi:aspartokinase/homoserine dehydrogenase 1